MTAKLAFVGDVHGNLDALQGLWGDLMSRDVKNVIFLGDYINKGSQSAGVVQELIAYKEAGYATLLAGNHELALLDALEHRDLSGFLKMGGAATIQSYVGTSVAIDVLEEFQKKLPDAHLEALRHMPLIYETEDVIAEHTQSRTHGSKFHISAHVLVGDLPRIRPESAQIDTGCGYESGRLTALLWPSLAYIQVNNNGTSIDS